MEEDTISHATSLNMAESVVFLMTRHVGTSDNACLFEYSLNTVDRESKKRGGALDLS